MARWTQTWLDGPSLPGSRDGQPGVRLGLPPVGPGSVAPTGTRVVAFAVDAVLSGLVARLFFPIRATGEASLSAGLAPVVAIALVYLVGLSLTGQTIGMRLRRLRVVQLPAPAGPPTFLAVALRTALLLLLVPALVTDADGRGLHDKAGRTVVVRA